MSRRALVDTYGAFLRESSRLQNRSAIIRKRSRMKRKDRLLPSQNEDHSRCLCLGSCNIVEAHDAWCIFFGDLENRSMVRCLLGTLGSY